MVKFYILPLSSGTPEAFDLPESTIIYVYPSNIQIAILKRKLYYVQCRPSFAAVSNKGEKFSNEEDAQKRAAQLREELKLWYEEVKKIGGLPMTLKELKKLPPKMLRRCVRIAQHPLRSDNSTNEALWLHPYWLGGWLGDGHQTCTTFTSADYEVVKWMTDYAESLNLTYIERKRKEIYTNKSSPYIVPRSMYTVKRTFDDVEARKKFSEWHNDPEKYQEAKCWTDVQERWWKKQIAKIGTQKFLTYNKIRHGLVRYNLLSNKHVPPQFLQSSRWVRLAALAGLIDTDGTLDGNTYVIVQKRDQLSSDIVNLSKSLGFFVRRDKTFNKSGVDAKGDWYNKMTISGLLTDEVPVLIKRKMLCIWKSSQIYLPRLSFNGEENGTKKRRSNLKWTKEEENELAQAVKTHGQRWSMIRRDPQLQSLVKTKNLSYSNVRNKCKRMRLDV